MIAAEDALAVGEDRVLVLHHTVRRQSAVLLGKIHRAAVERHADADAGRFLRLDVHRLLKTGRIEVVVVGRARAAGHQQLGLRQPRREAERLRLHVLRPDRIERLQPGKEFLVDRRRMRPRQRLEEVMVRVDEAGNDDVARGVEDMVGFLANLLAATNKLDDLAVLDNDTALSALTEHRQRVLDRRAASVSLRRYCFNLDQELGSREPGDDHQRRGRRRIADKTVADGHVVLHVLAGGDEGVQADDVAERHTSLGKDRLYVLEAHLRLPLDGGRQQVADTHAQLAGTEYQPGAGGDRDAVAITAEGGADTGRNEETIHWIARPRDQRHATIAGRQWQGGQQSETCRL